MKFSIDHCCATTAARVGIIETLHGSFATPAFMPVATRGAMKGLTPDQVRASGSEILLNNAYHLMLRPGSELIRQLGGSHEFMQWHGPILTDSGGYQAFSMSNINSIDNDGVTFKSIIDGSMVRLTPERSIAVQNDLGADIIMAFDDCPPADASVERLHIANDRTLRWLERCVAAHARPDEQALFGIVQGGCNDALRRASAEAVCSVDLSGYAIGGVAVGEGPDEIRRVVEGCAGLLPVARPRYLMGVGYERDIVMAVRAGVDMFDCVLPTRNGRNATAFSREGRLQMRNARFADDAGPVDAACGCVVCRGGFSRAYLRHLFMSGEMLGPTLLSLHNMSHFQALMVDIRLAVRENDWAGFFAKWPIASGW
ncbi:MAG: tRNA guanosine(34) transglycosylase Tgt [Phycisphaerales bacterium]